VHEVIQGDCIEVLKEFDDNTFDSVVTDPPYALSFMGKEWDSFGDGVGYQAWCEQWARECLRVLKPGGHLLAFGGTRTYHRLTVAIEDAGFEIRDSLHWIYGSGFPKSRDISKAIDSEAGAEREVIGKRTDGRYAYQFSQKASRSGGVMGSDAIQESRGQITAPATEDAKAWAGWGTALKPAHEPIVMARKPLAVVSERSSAQSAPNAKHSSARKTVAANVLEFGTGGINIDGCRVLSSNYSGWVAPASKTALFATENRPWKDRLTGNESWSGGENGRWPPNVILTHSPECEPTGGTRRVRSAGDRGTATKAVGGILNHTSERMPTAGTGYADADGMETVEAWDCANDCPIEEMDRQSGTLKSGNRKAGIYGLIGYRDVDKPTQAEMPRIIGDSGGASRFFPCFRYCAKAGKKERPVVDGIPGHPTVKPVALMQWLVKLVTPPAGYVLDPFAGTGTTAEACELEGFNCLLIERDADSIQRIEKRMSKYETGVDT
jgi:site-specific DNA-methyltransferase (adenine-specific)